MLKSASTDPNQAPHPEAYRKAMKIALAYLMNEAGVQASEESVLETLTEMMQSFLCSLGINGKNYCELAGRTDPVLGDVVLSLVNMGFSLDGLESYARRPKKYTLGPLLSASGVKSPSLLHTGLKKNFPMHVFDYLPAFPDSHAYINTITHKQPATEYEIIREKAAIQKRDVEKALTRYMARTCPTQSFFLNDDTAFPLIDCRPLDNPSASALLPRDQIFEEEEEEAVPVVIERRRIESVRHDADESIEACETKEVDMRTIDNPFLRAAKLPPKLSRKR
ncbi:transcription initiation factor TFIID subunit 8-like [Artemia franciscana]|uniref:Transcription initiation factor TFIID subunit 8 n=1 Tax=Artemia franciscana TaxID=6661 RepID=A0AA88H6N6_ARTSF|nr:hypothetical protein QYM36_018423 [Artemia franciscana]KAK2703026.1 hypothetical protein QYM36_018423 [Artemia franciscana]